MKPEASWLECPVCEYRFSVPIEYLEKSGKCPKCDSIFLAHDSQLPEKAPLAEQAAPEIPIPSVLDSAGLTPADNELHSDFASSSERLSPGSLQTGPKVQTRPSASPDYNQPYVTADKKQTNPNKVLFLIACCCLIAIAFLIGIPAVANLWIAKNNTESPDSPTSPESPTNPTPLSTPPTTTLENRGSQKKQIANSKKKKSLKKPIKQLTSEELKEIWSTCYPSIVLVHSKRDSTSLTSHGVVVSGDGKIAVGLSYVEGMESVRVRFAGKHYGGEPRWEDPIKATAIISSNPSLNLAIIQIPKQTTPAVFRSEKIKENEQGWFPVLVNKSAKDYLRRTRLNPAKPHADLTDSEKKSLRDSKLEPAPNDYFTVHSAKVNKNGVGSPIFDKTGKLMGIHMVHEGNGQSSLAIPTSSVNKLANNPAARPVNLSVLK
ncbi:MAG: hypothetical protein VX438_01515, partial [Planctomycetota bacterium]|nr:hypothetical protein [Planctomycetota bacterium]